MHLSKLLLGEYLSFKAIYAFLCYLLDLALNHDRNSTT